MNILAVGECPADSPRAHAVNVTKTAGGFARLGHEVTLAMLPAEESSMHESLAARFCEPNLKRRSLAADAVGDSAVEIAREIRAEVVYARSFHAAAACSRAGFPTVLETHAHAGDRNPLLLRTLALAASGGPLAGVATISQTLRTYYTECGADPSRVHVVPDGVDLEMFTPPATPPLAPWRGDGRPHAVYAGHLYDYKGIPTILDAAAMLPHWSFDLVGGMPEDIAAVTKRIASRGLKNVILHGQRPYAEVPRWLWCADALLLVPLATDPSANWTSPVKLGEYLASGAPIIASDIPGLRAWVGEPEVAWCEPGNAAALAEAIRGIRNESQASRDSRRRAARSRAEMYCYPRRARSLLEIAGILEHA